MSSTPIILPSSVCVNDYEKDGHLFFALKISTDAFEINVRFPSEDASKFGQIINTPWLSGAIKIGECADAPVYWCADEDKKSISVLVGQDDETWDFGLYLPAEVIETILNEIKSITEATNANGNFLETD